MKSKLYVPSIHYVVKNEEQENPVLFIHGNSHDHKSFSLQESSPLFKNHRIISLDLPGHGDSDARSEYSAIILAQSVYDFLDILNLKDAILVGHSLGAHVIMHLLELFTPKGIFIYGAPPLKRPLDMSGFKDCPQTQALFKEDVTENEKNELISCLYQDPQSDPFISQSFDKTDPKFRSEILASLTNGQYFDEAKLLDHYKGPKAVLSAQKDQLINPLYLEQNIKTQNLWNNEIIQLSGAHNLHRDVPDEFNRTLLSFLNQISLLKL